MKKIAKKLLIIIVIIIFIMAFSSSYFSLSMDNLAYVLAIGIDKSDENKLQVSFQFSTTSAIGESGGSTSKIPTVVNTVNASSLSNAINLMNSYLGKQVNMSHCKVIVFSEELAKEGISSEIYTLINDTQIRPSANIIVSKTDSKYYIEKTEPELESLISKYYEILTNSSQYTGFTPDATIGDFFNSLVCKTCSPHAILGGVTNENSLNIENSTMPDSQKDYNIEANNSALVGSSGSENIGVAVFNQDTLVRKIKCN